MATLMLKPRFSFYTIPFKGEAFGRSAERLARFGYDGIEVPGDPSSLPASEVCVTLRATGLNASAVCPRVYGPDRDLSAGDAGDRAKAVAYFRSLIEFAVQIGAPTVIVAPTAVRRTMPDVSIDEDWRRAVESISTVAQDAAAAGVSLALEPWNRYETFMLNRVEQADRMRREIGSDSVGVMADLFHMNIEETDIAAAISSAGPYLLNIHFADSNRHAPGQGHIDLVPVMRALQRIGYAHYLSAEFLPPRFIFEHGSPPEFYDPYCLQTITVLKQAFDAAKGLEA